MGNMTCSEGEEHIRNERGEKHGRGRAQVEGGLRHPSLYQHAERGETHGRGRG